MPHDGVATPGTLAELLLHRARATPDAPALLDGDAALSFAALARRAAHAAVRLRALGVDRDTVVPVLAPRSATTVVALHGVLQSGAAYLPLGPTDPEQRLAALLERVPGPVLVAAEPVPDALARGRRVVPLADLVEGEAEPRPSPARPDDLAYVIFTSGTAGRPKGVLVEHRAVVHRLRWMQRHYQVGPGDVLLQKTPLTFDVSVWELFLGAASGAALAVLPPGEEADPRALVDAVARHRVTLLHFVPSMLQAFLTAVDDADVLRLTSLRRVFCSGEVLAPALARRFGARLGARLSNLYGPTEATIDATFHDCPAAPDTVPIGAPIDGVDAWILDGDHEVEDGTVGELCLGGVTLARGYLDDPALTAARFPQHPQRPGTRIYRTGDLALRGADGALHFRGRLDRQIKLRGVRIEPAEVEHALREQPGVRDAVVVARSFAPGVDRLVGYVVAKSSVDLDAVHQGVRALLPEPLVPSKLMRLDALPHTAHGKVDLRALPAVSFGAPC